MSALAGSLSTTGSLSGALSASALSGSLSIGLREVTYDGPYTFIPTRESQTVSISNKTATQDITIEAIPSNYGLITWNGSALTVS